KVLANKGQGFIVGLRVTPDGQLIGTTTASSEREYNLGSIEELLEVTMKAQARICANNPSADNVATLQRMQAELAYIRRELAAGRALDFSKPPLTGVLARLGGDSVPKTADPSQASKPANSTDGYQATARKVIDEKPWARNGAADERITPTESDT